MTMHEVKALAALIDLLKKEQISGDIQAGEFIFTLPMPAGALAEQEAVKAKTKKPDPDPMDKPNLLDFITKKIPPEMWSKEQLPDDLKEKDNEQSTK